MSAPDMPPNGSQNFVTRGEFGEFREEVRASLSAVSTALNSFREQVLSNVPNKSDMAAAIRSEIGVSRQLSPGIITAIAAVLVIGGALYQNDQNNTKDKMTALASVTDGRFERVNDRDEQQMDMLIHAVRERTKTDTKVEYVEKQIEELKERILQQVSEGQRVDDQFDVRIQREMDLKDEIKRLQAEVNRLKGRRQSNAP